MLNPLGSYTGFSLQQENWGSELLVRSHTCGGQDQTIGCLDSDFLMLDNHTILSACFRMVVKSRADGGITWNVDSFLLKIPAFVWLNEIASVIIIRRMAVIIPYVLGVRLFAKLCFSARYWSSLTWSQRTWDCPQKHIFQWKKSMM